MREALKAELILDEFPKTYRTAVRNSKSEKLSSDFGFRDPASLEEEINADQFMSCRDVQFPAW